MNITCKSKASSQSHLRFPWSDCSEIRDLKHGAFPIVSPIHVHRLVANTCLVPMLKVNLKLRSLNWKTHASYFLRGGRRVSVPNRHASQGEEERTQQKDGREEEGQNHRGDVGDKYGALNEYVQCADAM